MNKGMKAGLALLVRLPLWLVILWLFGLATGAPDIFGFMTLFAVTIGSFSLALFLSCWFGVMLRKSPTLLNVIRYYLLSLLIGVFMANAFVLSIVVGAKGFQLGIEEYLRSENRRILIILSAGCAVFTVLLTTASAFEKPESSDQNKDMSEPE